MPRIPPLSDAAVNGSIREAFEEHVRLYQARITNMKATLGHSPVAFQAYMQWYPLYQELTGIVGHRAAYLYAYAISTASNCPLCSTFFRKIIVDAGEDPDALQLLAEEKELLEFGSSIARFQGYIADHIYRPIAVRYDHREQVVLTAFAGQMIATNIFNNVVETDIDNYLIDYLPPVKSIWHHAK